MQTVSLDVYWCNLIVEELIRQHCDYFCISPGSRSTPLTVAVAKNNKARSKIIYDERSAAFHALGYSKATGKPAALICTSGTSVANYYPAVIEAKQDSIQLIVITADRPPELRDTGSNQTIDQVKIYGNYVKWFIDLPVPDLNISPRFVLTSIDQACIKASNSPRGPVHLNCMFREPFFKEEKIEVDNAITKWEKSDKPFTVHQVGNKNFFIDPTILGIINSVNHGLIIAGKMDSKSDSDAVINLAEKLNWPLFADITSGLRTLDSDLIIKYFDLALLSKTFRNLLNPEVIIQFGKRFISKRLFQYITESNPQNYFLVDDSPDRFDPAHLVSNRILANVSQLCESLIPQIQQNTQKPFVKSVISTNSRIKKLIKKEFSSEDISEVLTARIISKSLPANSGLYLSNSMPVRDMDMFADNIKSGIKIAANRGTSGIDGNIASAIGFAEGLKSVVTIIIGDLAFIHDLNSLLQLVKSKYPVIVILVNNSGGGIFSFLPISEKQDVFEKYFATPHNLTFANAAALFNLNYYNPKSGSDLKKIYKNALNQKRSSIIEININRKENYYLHQQFYEKIKNLLGN